MPIRPFLAILLLAGAALAAPVAVVAAPPYRGRPVDDVLHELSRSGGFQLVYTATQVDAAARVEREPVPGPALEVVAQVLAPLGLSLRPVDARTYVLVRESPANAAATAPATSAGEPTLVPLSEIVVTASRYTLSADVPDVHLVLTQAQLEALPRLAEDALKAVHRLPGAASNGLAGLAHMRGGDASETQVLFDGLPLYEPFHLRLLQSPASVLDERVIAGLDVYAGGFTADYGDRMSAIIDARSLHPEPDQYYELGLSLMHVNALASQRFGEGRGQWLAAYRRSNLDEVADFMQSDLGEPSYSDAFARIDYEWSPRTRGSLHVLLAQDSATVNSTTHTETAKAEYSNRYLWGTLEHDWSEQLHLGALVSFTDVSSERHAVVDDPGRRQGHADDERDYDVLGLKLDATYETGRWLQRAGVDLRALDARYDYASEVEFAAGYPFPGSPAYALARSSKPKPSGHHVAVYYTVRGRLTDSITAEAGVRWDEQSYNTDSDGQVAPRLNVAWHLDAKTRLLASWGRYQQFQGIEELQVEDGVDKFAPAQHADHAILGLERDLSPAWRLRVEAYRKDYGSLATRFESLYDPLSLAPELRWDRVAIAPSSSRAEGAEVLLTRGEPGPWSGWFGYAWSHITDDVAGDEIRRSWDQTNTVTTGIGWTSGPWQATVAGQYHTGWPVTPIAMDPTGVVTLGPRNSSRYKDFGSLDARVSYEWQLPRGSLELHAEVTNALDRRNPCCTDFDVEDEDGTPVLEREYRHWLPLVPTVGVLWKF